MVGKYFYRMAKYFAVFYSKKRNGKHGNFSKNFGFEKIVCFYE